MNGSSTSVKTAEVVWKSSASRLSSPVELLHLTTQTPSQLEQRNFQLAAIFKLDYTSRQSPLPDYRYLEFSQSLMNFLAIEDPLDCPITRGKRDKTIP